MVIVKLPHLYCSLLTSRLAKGMGHNTYGEPAWPNDILYVFPIVILGFFQLVLGLAVYEPLGLGQPAKLIPRSSTTQMSAVKMKSNSKLEHLMC